MAVVVVVVVAAATAGSSLSMAAERSGSRLSNWYSMASGTDRPLKAEALEAIDKALAIDDMLPGWSLYYLWVPYNNYSIMGPKPYSNYLRPLYYSIPSPANFRYDDAHYNRGLILDDMGVLALRRKSAGLYQSSFGFQLYHVLLWGL